MDESFRPVGHVEISVKVKDGARCFSGVWEDKRLDD